MRKSFDPPKSFLQNRPPAILSPHFSFLAIFLFLAYFAFHD